jgi:hypothetical protein
VESDIVAGYFGYRARYSILFCNVVFERENIPRSVEKLRRNSWNYGVLRGKLCTKLTLYGMRKYEKKFLGAVARAKISAKPKIPGEFAVRSVAFLVPRHHFEHQTLLVKTWERQRSIPVKIRLRCAEIDAIFRRFLAFNFLVYHPESRIR